MCGHLTAGAVQSLENKVSVQTRTRNVPHVATIQAILIDLYCRSLAVARVLAPYVFTIAVALIALPSAHAANSATGDPAETFVQDSIDKGYTILNDSALSADERENRFRAFLISVLDMRRIAAFTLGPYERRASVAELDDFDKAFTDYIATIYQQKLDAYTGQTIHVTGSMVRAADDVIVTANTVGAASTQPPVNLAFRVRNNNNGKNSIIDVQVEGIWLALTQRDEFTDYLQQHGGDIQGLTNELGSRAQGIHGSAPHPIRTTNSR
jgi:phospholipid transport system substrate-binding protein